MTTTNDNGRATRILLVRVRDDDGRRVDLAVSGDAPTSELVPTLLGFFGYAVDTGSVSDLARWRLLTGDGRELVGPRSMLEAGVLDGEELHLTRGKGGAA